MSWAKAQRPERIRQTRELEAEMMGGIQSRMMDGKWREIRLAGTEKLDNL